MAIRLSRPPEPSKPALAERISTTGLDSFTGEETGDDWKLKLAVPSFLWSDHWKDTLTEHGVSWNEFESKSPTWAIGEWAAGEDDWDYVLKWYADSLDAQIE